MCDASLPEKLQVFSPESRPDTSDLIQAVLRASSSTYRSSKELGTARTRALHYFAFAICLGWHKGPQGEPDLLFEWSSKHAPEKPNLCFSAYVIHLSQGNTILCKSVGLKTIKDYVASVANIIKSFTGVDYRLTVQGESKIASPLKNVYDELARYETVPNRREPYTPEMHAIAEKTLLSEMHNSRPFSKYVVLTRWFGMGLQAGFRKSEWCQDHGMTDPRAPQMNHLKAPNNQTMAFCLGDVRVQNSAGKHFVGADILQTPKSSLRNTWLKWKTQKNKQHGEEKLFTSSQDDDKIGLGERMYDTIDTFVQLQKIDPNLDETTPLSVYLDYGTNTVKLITSSDVEDYMRSLAVAAYNLCPTKDKKKLMKWSCHSLRVGACVLLHTMGYDATSIQWILRWRSNTFMMYLRNVAILADQHRKDYNKALGMPFTF